MCRPCEGGIERRSQSRLEPFTQRTERTSVGPTCPIQSTVSIIYFKHDDRTETRRTLTSKVVELAGHPLPDPSRFCNVTNAALILVASDALESSVGN